MTDLEEKLATILACLPDSPFKGRVREVHAEALNEIERRNSMLADWQRFASDVQPRDAAGADWLDMLNHKTNLLMPTKRLANRRSARRRQTGVMDMEK